MKKEKYYDILEEIDIYNKTSEKINFIKEKLISFGENITLKELLERLYESQKKRNFTIKALMSVEE